MFETLLPVMGDFGATAILAVVVMMIIAGKGISTRRETDAAERWAKTWKEAFETERAANNEKDQHLLTLLTNTETIVKLLEALPRKRGDDEP